MSSRNNSLQLKAEAKRMTDAESRGIDGKVYDHSKIKKVSGGFEMPINPDGFLPGHVPKIPDLKVAVPTDVAMRLREIWWASGDAYNPAIHRGTSYDLSVSEVARYMEQFDGAQLLDLPAAEEFNLRRDYKIDPNTYITSLLCVCPRLIPGTFQNWNPAGTSFEMTPDCQHFVVFFKDTRGQKIFGVAMQSYRV